MKYGHFSADGREYIVTDPALPGPWSNYLTNGRYCAFLSPHGRGYAFWRDPFLHGITRWTPVDTAVPCREVYVRDEESGEYWSLNWEPDKPDYEAWQCRIGQGYNRLTALDEAFKVLDTRDCCHKSSFQEG